MRASLLPPSPALPHVTRRIAPLCALAQRHRGELGTLAQDAAADRLAELNVFEQVRLLRASPILRDAERAPLVHGWIFSLADGRLIELASGYVDQSAGIARPNAEISPALG